MPPKQRSYLSVPPNHYVFRGFIFLFLGWMVADNKVMAQTGPNANTVQSRVAGVVINYNDDPLVGATVLNQTKSNAITTDSTGRFLIAAEKGEVLIISSIGFVPYKIVVGSEIFYSVKLAMNDISLEGITVVGSRGRPRTDVSRPAPVDVISSKELENTGQVDLGQMAQFTSPSFNSAKNGINGVVNFADPSTLRGMSPDQSLLLINGKRRHQFSALNNNITVGKGTVPSDLNCIPAMAVEHMEILRDGAAAQYGSDAIAGIINLALKRNINSGSFRSQFGVTQKGDGATAMAALNYGFGLGKAGSFFNFTLHYQYAGETNRTDPYSGIFYNTNKSTDDSIRNARGVWPTNKPAHVTTYGSNETKVYQAFINAGYPLGRNWSLYSFGGASRKDLMSYGFFRNARPGDPNSNPDLFGDGYTPELPGTSMDYSLVTGLNKKSITGWNVDLSIGYGQNYLDLYANNTTNPSLGAQSPTRFYTGRSTFGQTITEASVSRSFDGALGTKSINVALGSQFRIDNFKLAAGDSDSYIVGPLAATHGKAPGSSGRPGIGANDVANESRSNVGVFVDVETDITNKFLLAAAARYEHYSDFGGNISGKLAARYNITNDVAIRASINHGFRAPSLQQLYNNLTTSNAQVGIIRQTKQLRSDDPRLPQLGVNYPHLELSWNYNLGLTAKAGKLFLFTLDAYQINVSDRIVISEQLPVGSTIPALLKAFPASTGIKEITFFTNHINTRTKGIDVVAQFKQRFTRKHAINASLAFTFNSTTVSSQRPTPTLLEVGATVPIKIIDTISISLIETSKPRNKLLASFSYTFGKLSVTAKATYFGKVIVWEKPVGLPHRMQIFGGKTLTDATINYDFSKVLSLTIGANNLFNVYPDKVLANYASYSNGQIPYTRNANQFGFNGAFYYTTLGLKF
jgi:iron complex outermembrane receptor protein